MGLCLFVLLAGCGTEGVPTVETARPVLVLQPGGGAESAVSAYAGEIRAREEATLSFRVGGSVIRRSVDVGEHVKRGQLLAELDAGDLRLQAQASQAQVSAATAELNRASADRARFARLAEQQLVSRSAYDGANAAYQAAASQAKAARAQLDVAGNQAAYSQLRAPRDGVIALRLAEAGQVVAAGQPVFTLAGDSGREVAIALPESRIRDVGVGQPALVELWNGEGQRMPGTIREISPVADPQARTYAARVALRGDAAQAVELGQSARVYLADDRDGTGNAALSVPLSALQRGAGAGGTKDGAALWVVDTRTRKVHLTPVRLGAYGEDRVPVLDGIAADAWIVVAGGHLLREGQAVLPVDRDNRPVLPGAATAVSAKAAR
ncbi:MAG: efflux RND transporter periplasmic adaptor subunit [Luteimonas sp.]